MRFEDGSLMHFAGLFSSIFTSLCLVKRDVSMLIHADILHEYFLEASK